MKEAPRPTIERLVTYYRYLERLILAEERKIVSSTQLGSGVGVSSAQVRKDLSYFGEFGCKGVGYDISSLKRCLERILGFNRNWPIIMVGAGNIGRALVNYQGFRLMGLNIVEIFDSDLNKIGNAVNDLTVRSNKEIEKLVARKNIKLAIIAVPADKAQSVAERLVKSGIKAIWNFAPTTLKLPDGVIVHYEDLASSLVSLTYRLGQNDDLIADLN